MRKFFSFIAFVALSAMMLCSCSDSDSDPVPSPGPEAEGPDYLVMVYGVGGGTLDHCIVANIMQALNEGGNDKVKMTFQYKLSKNLQTYPELESFDGTRRFTCDDNVHLKGKFESLTSDYPFIPSGQNTKEKAGEISKCSSQLKTQRFADAKYNMACSEGLSDFIKWSNGKYPDAKRKLLIINDHGGGWSFYDDGMKDTRGILSDDNVNNELSLNDVVNGINNGGGVDILYDDACLMSTYENMYGYAKCAKYLVASFETAPGAGGDYTELIKLLKNAGSGEADLENAMKKYVDHITSDSWWGKYVPTYNGDIGFFNLSKLGEVTPILKNVASTLAEKSVSEESIEPTKETVYGDKYLPYIRIAAQTCVVSHSDTYIAHDDIPENLLPYMKEDGLEWAFGEPYFYIYDVVKWIRYAKTENAKEAYEKYPNSWLAMRYKIAYYNRKEYSITHMLRLLDQDLSNVGAKNPFKQLRQDLLDAIKSFAYIKCTLPLNPAIIDTAYELCSPGVTLVPLNEYYDNEVANSLVDEIPDYRDALRYYQNTEFDRQVGWSKFLERLDVIPSALTNTMRQHIGMLYNGE